MSVQGALHSPHSPQSEAIRGALPSAPLLSCVPGPGPTGPRTRAEQNEVLGSCLQLHAAPKQFTAYIYFLLLLLVNTISLIPTLPVRFALLSRAWKLSKPTALAQDGTVGLLCYRQGGGPTARASSRTDPSC